MARRTDADVETVMLAGTVDETGVDVDPDDLYDEEVLETAEDLLLRESEDGPPESAERIALYLEPAKLPRLEITDGFGVTRHRTVGLAELVTILDKSAVLEALEREAIHTALTPELPERTLMAGVIEAPTYREIVATGWLPPREHPFVWEGRSYLVRTPVIVWRAVWREGQKRLTSLKLAVTKPDRQDADSDTPLYRWPFSNVYSGNGYSEVCWYTMREIELEMKDVVRLGVQGFLSVEDNGDLFGVGRSHNSEHKKYADFLAAAEVDGIKEEWLIPHTHGHSVTDKANEHVTVGLFHQLGGKTR